jgi:hypothetical protein
MTPTYKDEVYSYLKDYRKKNRKFITYQKFIDYMHRKFFITKVYVTEENKLVKYYRESDFKMLNYHILNSNITILVFVSEGIVIFGPEFYIKQVNIVEPILSGEFKNEVIKLKFKDPNGIICDSCKIILTCLSIDSVYFNSETIKCELKK